MNDSQEDLKMSSDSTPSSITPHEVSTIKTTKKHTSKFNAQNNSNKYLELADSFLEYHSEILFWTEPNDSKRGIFYQYKNGVYKPCSSFEIEDLLLSYTPMSSTIAIPRALSNSKFQETMIYVKRRRFFYREVFNPENIVNFKNGFFNVNTGKLIPHSMEIVSTIQLPYEYDKDAKCPLFMKVLNESLSGDLAKIGIIQEFMGYCLIPTAKYERALFLVGASRTGKSTVLDSIEATLGHENCSAIRLDMLCNARFTGHLVDKYVNIDREVPNDINNYEEALKKVISGEKITVDTKFLPSYDTNLTCKLMFAANDLPRISDTSNAVFERILLLDFNNVVDADKRDANLKDKIKQNERAGIFNWAYEGLKRLNKNGYFTSSTDMVSILEDLKLLNNSVYYFIRENYEITSKEEHYVEVDILYEDYTDFCHKIGAKGIYKKTIFGKELKKIFIKSINQDFVRKDKITKRAWIGIRRRGDISQMTIAEKDKIQWND